MKVNIQPADRISSVKPYYFATKLAEIRKLSESGTPVLNLGIGSPDLSPSREVIDVLSASAQMPSHHGYQSYRGTRELREAFSQFYQKKFQVALDSESEILPLIGSKEGIMHLSMALLNPGDTVLIPDPGYPAYKATAQIAGASIMTYQLLETNDYQIDVSSLYNLDASSIKLMWINSPHMPTGSSQHDDTIAALIEWATENQVLLCHDNPYTFIRSENPKSLLSSAGAAECCVELISLSKSHNMAGWRVAALAGRADVIDYVMRFKSNMDSGQFKAIQDGAIEALNCPSSWHQELNHTYDRRASKACKILEELDCSFRPNQSGLFIWAKAPEYIVNVVHWIDEILYQARVFITPGFIFGSAGDRYVRISLCADENQLDEALKRIRSANLKAKMAKA